MSFVKKWRKPMPKVVRCCICGRLCDEPIHDAFPYKTGCACHSCYVIYVKPANKERQEKLRRKYQNGNN